MQQQQLFHGGIASCLPLISLCRRRRLAAATTAHHHCSSLLVRAGCPSSVGRAALGFGAAMPGSHCYLAHPEDGIWRLRAYSLASYSASGIARTDAEPLNVSSVSQVDGLISFSFTRPLLGFAGGPALSADGLSMLWALGNTWARRHSSSLLYYSNPPQEGICVRRRRLTPSSSFFFQQ